MPPSLSSERLQAGVPYRKYVYRQEPGRLAAETSTPCPRVTVPGENRVSFPSRTTLNEPFARQGDTPAGQELSRLCGSSTAMTMLWSNPSASVVKMDSPVMYVISGRDGTGLVTRCEATGKTMQGWTYNTH